MRGEANQAVPGVGGLIGILVLGFLALLGGGTLVGAFVILMWRAVTHG